MENFLLLGICFIAGYFLKHLNRLPENTPIVLNSIMIFISLPSLVLLHVHKIKFETTILAIVAMAWIQFFLAYLIFTFIGKKLNFSKETVGCLILVCGLGNTSFVGLPMIEVFFGKNGIPVGLLIDQLGSFLALSTVGIITTAGFSGKSYDKKTLIRTITTFPPFLALVITILLIPVKFPAALENILERLGSTLAPLALFSVGFQLRINDISKHLKPVATGMVLKLFILPLLIFLIYFYLLGSRGFESKIAVFESAMPPMITAAIIAYEYKLNRELAALLVGLGIPLSFLTLFLWWFLLNSY